MFKYPLAVTIDTNIFDAAKFDLCDTSPLKTLENYVKNGKIKVVLSDIVVRESKRHIADQVKKICGIMRKARAAALEESTEHLIRTIGLGEILRIVTNKDELISKGEEMFDDFLRTINTEILGAELIDVGLVLGDYFETKPGGADKILDYADRPSFCLYSSGLSPPRDILIRFSRYQTI